MEDRISLKSSDSTGTSDEYDFLSPVDNKVSDFIKAPTLEMKSENFQKELDEVLNESCNNTTNTLPPLPLNREVAGSIEHVSLSKPEDVISPEEDIDQECTIFNGVTYLGAANINAPKSELEIHRNMAILNEQTVEQGIKVSVSVPSCSTGIVVLYDAATKTPICRYEICRIIFYARGTVDSKEAGCFAFTWSHGETVESAIFQCHVFRCDIPEAVSQVSACFIKAFQRTSRSMTSSIISNQDMTSSGYTISENQPRFLICVFELSLEIREDDGKGNFTTAPRDRTGFKIHSNSMKQIWLTVKQVTSEDIGSSTPLLHIERCFGVLLALGRNVKHSDMQLLEMVSISPSRATNTVTDPAFMNSKNSVETTPYVSSGLWNPKDPVFNQLNMETSKESPSQYITIAADLVISNISEPVRFFVETPVRVFAQNERFFSWNFAQKRTLVHQFFVHMKEVSHAELGEQPWFQVINIETSGELDRSRLNLMLNFSGLKRTSSLTSLDMLTPKEELNLDGDEPLLSGTGCVSRDCSDELLGSWSEIVLHWEPNTRPKGLDNLVILGIPEALRPEAWLRLSCADQDQQIMDTYRVLITKECSFESVIERDINRTFPAHEYFRQVGGIGQDSLYRISKAYAVYDKEVGYCQGLSFLAASLLLHMPEEQSFCVLVKLMYDYKLRDLYKDGFENLHLRLYQLNRLMEEHLPQLWLYFASHNVETHMFASQWFLTLFTARFPLYFVFHVLDVILLRGLDTLFQVSLALLSLCKKDLLMLDFEGILKYFRVSLPRRCLTEDISRRVMKYACSIKLKRLKKYESEFLANREPQENIPTQSPQIDQLESLKSEYAKQEEHRQQLLEENARLKTMLRNLNTKHDMKSSRDAVSIAEYKKMCRELEKQNTAAKNAVNEMKDKLCEKCQIWVSDVKNDYDNKLDYANMNADDRVHDISSALERIRELELELAQVKLEYVESQCQNQELIHQLNNAHTELHTAKNSWSPWLTNKITSLKEAAANKKDNLQIYPNANPAANVVNNNLSALFTQSGNTQSLNHPNQTASSILLSSNRNSVGTASALPVNRSTGARSASLKG